MRYQFFGLIASLFLLLSGAAESQQAISFSNELLQGLQSYELQLEEFESEFGPLSENLLEPLGSIAALLETQGDYEGLMEIQNRQLALMRINLGLEHPDLVPLVRLMIENQKRLGNWEAITDQLELIRSLQLAIYGSHSDEFFAAIEGQAFWYLTLLNIDVRSRPGRNFMRARDLYKELEDLAEDRYGEDSPELFPWYYKRANNLAQLVALLNSDDKLTGSVLDEVVRADGVMKLEQYTPPYLTSAWGVTNRLPLVAKDRLIGEAYLRDGLRRINKIRDIAEETGDKEALAMANLYHGDFRILMNQGGSRSYRRAYEQFLEIGVDTERIEALLNQPIAIPLPTFFDRFADLEAYHEANRSNGTSVEDLLYVGDFTAWDEDAKSIAKPQSKDPLLHVELPYYQADLKFRLSTRGKTSSIDVLHSEPEERGVERRAYRALRDIFFRPSIVEGKVTRIRDLQIRYYYFERNN